MRRALLVLVAVVSLCGLVPPAARAQDSPDTEPTSGITVSEDVPRVSSLPRPDPNARPLRDTDPGGWQQVALFAFLLVGMGGIVLLAARDINSARARRDALAAGRGGLEPGAQPVDHLDRP